MMGGYFLSMSIGSFVAGRLATLTQLPGDATRVSAESLDVYVSAYALFGTVAVGASAGGGVRRSASIAVTCSSARLR